MCLQTQILASHRMTTTEWFQFVSFQRQKTLARWNIACSVKTMAILCMPFKCFLVRWLKTKVLFFFFKKRTSPGCGHPFYRNIQGIAGSYLLEKEDLLEDPWGINEETPQKISHLVANHIYDHDEAPA